MTREKRIFTISIAFLMSFSATAQTLLKEQQSQMIFAKTRETAVVESMITGSEHKYIEKINGKWGKYLQGFTGIENVPEGYDHDIAYVMASSEEVFVLEERHNMVSYQPIEFLQTGYEGAMQYKTADEIIQALPERISLLHHGDGRRKKLKMIIIWHHQCHRRHQR